MNSSVYWFLLLFTTCASVTLNHNSGDDNPKCDQRNKCVKKCCPEKHVLKKKVCVLDENSDFTFDVYDKTRNITHENITLNVIHDYITNCKDRKKLKLSPKFNEVDEFYVQSDGTLYKPLDNVSTFVKFTDYCLDTFVLPAREELSALVCYGEEKLEKIDQFAYVGE